MNMPEVLVRRRVRVRKRGLKGKLGNIYGRNRSTIVMTGAIIALAVLGVGGFIVGQEMFDNPRQAGASSYGVPEHPQNH